MSMLLQSFFCVKNPNVLAKLLISSSLDKRVGEINKYLDLHLKSTATNHPDLLYFPFDSKLGIAEARKIKEFFSLKPYLAKGRVVVLEDAGNLTPEAQNALLKTLEELPKDGLLILAGDSESKFLPTVLSRCQVVRLEHGSTDTLTHRYTDIEKLLNSTIEQRFEYIEKLKDREEFLHSLVSYFHQNLNSHMENGNLFIKELLQAEEWAKQNVNIRAILEYLVLILPSRV